ncbi:MAG: hypothetical protein JXR03_02825 [Cyclobacteriaceae bacterium]
MDEAEKHIERRKQNFDLIKFILGTVGLGLTAHLINLHIQQNKIALEVKKSEMEYLDKFISRYVSTGKAQKLEFVDFMRYASHSEETRTLYNNFHSVLRKQLDSLRKEESYAKDILDSLFNINSKLSKDLKLIKNNLTKKNNDYNEVLKELKNTEEKVNENQKLLANKTSQLQTIEKQIGKPNIELSERRSYSVKTGDELDLPELTITPNDYNSSLKATPGYISFKSYDDTFVEDFYKNKPTVLHTSSGIYSITLKNYHKEGDLHVFVVEIYY